MPPPAAALPPAAAPLGDRKRSRAACAAEQYQLNEKYRQHHMDDSEAAGDVMIVVKDGTHSFVLASGVFVDLSDDALARVRAAAALAAEGASVDEVVRAALRSALGGDAPHHPDALPPRAALPALEYGDGL